jgi:hypothetical protein
MVLFYRIGSVGDHTVFLPAIKYYISINPSMSFGVITRCAKANVQAVVALYQMIGVQNIFFYHNFFDLIKLIRGLISNHSASVLISVITDQHKIRHLRDYIFFRTMTLGSGVSVVKPFIKKNQEVESVYISCFNAVFANLEKVPQLPNRFPETQLDFNRTTVNQCLKFFNWNINQRLIVCCPGSNMPSKIWSTERYIEVIRRAIRKYENVVFVLIGSENDVPIGVAIESEVRSQNVVNLVGKTTIQEASYLISRSELFFGNDTGPMHIASLLGKPILSIFSARDQIGKWYPLGKKVIIKRSVVSCQGCMLVRCNRPEHYCLTSISIDAVSNDLCEMLEDTEISR